VISSVFCIFLDIDIFMRDLVAVLENIV